MLFLFMPWDCFLTKLCDCLFFVVFFCFRIQKTNFRDFNQSFLLLLFLLFVSGSWKISIFNLNFVLECWNACWCLILVMTMHFVVPFFHFFSSINVFGGKMFFFYFVFHSILQIFVVDTETNFSFELFPTMLIIWNIYHDLLIESVFLHGVWERLRSLVVVKWSQTSIDSFFKHQVTLLWVYVSFIQ